MNELCMGTNAYEPWTQCVMDRFVILGLDQDKRSGVDGRQTLCPFVLGKCRKIRW